MCLCPVGMTQYNMLISEDLKCEENQGHRDERRRPPWRVQSWQEGAEVRDKGVFASGFPVFCCDSRMLPSLSFINKSILCPTIPRHNTGTSLRQEHFFSELYIVRILVCLLIAPIQSIPGFSNVFIIVKTIYSP